MNASHARVGLRLAALASFAALFGVVGCQRPEGATAEATSATPSGAAAASAPAAATSSGSASAASASASAAPTGGPVAGALPLAAGATFGDLVRAARDAKQGASGATCLLRGGKGAAPGSFEAYAPPKEPFDDPPDDLDALFAKPAPHDFDRGPRLFASWGATRGGDTLDLVALTPAPRSARMGVVLVLAITDKGRFIGILGQGGFQALPAADEGRLKEEILPKAPAIVVTAEAKTPISKIREALELVAPAKGSIVLATAKKSAGPPSHKPPSRYEADVKGGPYACDAKLKGGASGAEAGDYTQGQMAAAGYAFQAAVAPCLAASGADGSIHVMTRIKADGVVEGACAETDDTGDAAARKCVVEGIKAARFPAPSKPGIIPFGSAAVFPGRRVRALCDGAD